MSIPEQSTGDGASTLVAVCKDSYVVCARGFDRNRKMRMILRIKITLQNWRCKMMSQALTTLFADGIISDYSFNLKIHGQSQAKSETESNSGSAKNGDLSTQNFKKTETRIE